MSGEMRPTSEGGPGPVRVSVRSCQRCGQDHEGLQFEALANPVDEYRWWAPCPAGAQPILLRVSLENAASGWQEAAESAKEGEAVPDHRLLSVLRAARALLNELEGPPNEHGHRVIYNSAHPEARRALRLAIAAWDEATERTTRNGRTASNRPDAQSGGSDDAR